MTRKKAGRLQRLTREERAARLARSKRRGRQAAVKVKRMTVTPKADVIRSVDGSSKKGRLRREFARALEATMKEKADAEKDTAGAGDDAVPAGGDDE